MPLSLRYLRTAIEANEPERFFEAPSEESLPSAKRGITAKGINRRSTRDANLRLGTSLKMSRAELRNMTIIVRRKPTVETITKGNVLNLCLGEESLFARSSSLFVACLSAFLTAKMFVLSVFFAKILPV